MANAYPTFPAAYQSRPSSHLQLSPQSANGGWQGHDKESLVLGSWPHQVTPGSFPLVETREIPQLAPGLWKPPFREVSFRQLSEKSPWEGQGRWMHRAGETLASPQPRAGNRPLGTQKREGNSRKSPEGMGLNTAGPPWLGRALTAPDECFPQMKQFNMKQMPKTTPGYSVAVWKRETPGWGAVSRGLSPAP